MLTLEELKSVHNNVMTVMENRIMSMISCDRKTANLIANEVLSLDKESDCLLSERALTVQDMINELNKVENKSLPLEIYNHNTGECLCGIYDMVEMENSVELNMFVRDVKMYRVEWIDKEGETKVRRGFESSEAAYDWIRTSHFDIDFEMPMVFLDEE